MKYDRKHNDFVMKEMEQFLLRKDPAKDYGLADISRDLHGRLRNILHKIYNKEDV